MFCCYEVGLSPSDMYGGFRSLTFREFRTLFPSSTPLQSPRDELPNQRLVPDVYSPRCEQCGFWESSRVLEWTKYFFILSCGIILENAAKLCLSLCLSPSPSLSTRLSLFSSRWRLLGKKNFKWFNKTLWF